MSQAPDMQVLGVFDDRAALGATVGKLRGQGIGRDRLTVLGTEEAMRRHLGVEVGQAEGGEAADSPAGGVQEQRSVENLAPIVRTPEDLETARRVLAQEAERTVERPAGGGPGA